MAQKRRPGSRTSDEVLRSHAWLFVVAGAFVVTCAAGTVVTHQTGRWQWPTLALAGLTAFGIVGVIDLCLTHVRLSPDAVTVRSLMSCRRLARDEVGRVTWARGTGVAIELRAGGMVKIPELGRSSPTVAAQLRRWLNG